MVNNSILSSLVAAMISVAQIDVTGAHTKLTIADFEHFNECCTQWCQREEVLGSWIGKGLDPPAYSRDYCEEVSCGCTMVHERAANYYESGGYKHCQATNFNQGTCDCTRGEDGKVEQGRNYCDAKYGKVASIDGAYSGSRGACICRATLVGGSAGEMKKAVWKSDCSEHEANGRVPFPQSVCPDIVDTLRSMQAEAKEALDHVHGNAQNKLRGGNIESGSENFEQRTE